MSWQCIAEKDARRTKTYWSKWRYKFEVPESLFNDKEFYSCDRERELRATIYNHLVAHGPLDPALHRIQVLDFTRGLEGFASLTFRITAQKPSQRILDKHRACKHSGIRVETLPEIPLLPQWMEEALARNNDSERRNEKVSKLRKRSLQKVKEAARMVQVQALQNLDAVDRIHRFEKALNRECEKVLLDEEFQATLFHHCSQDGEILDVTELTLAKIDKWFSLSARETPMSAIPLEVLEEVTSPLSERIAHQGEDDE
tara:strand:+ start:2729 stop:3499 length:771 start_codon:yes stop_codon:yes gene_type:complete